MLSLWQGPVIELLSGISDSLGSENTARLVVTQAEVSSLDVVDIVVVISTIGDAEPFAVVKVVVSCGIFVEYTVIVILRIIAKAAIMSVTV